MFKAIYGRFWKVVGLIEGFFIGAKDSIKFIKWTKCWVKEHPEATDEMYEDYALLWWTERYPDVRIELTEAIKSS